MDAALVTVAFSRPMLAAHPDLLPAMGLLTLFIVNLLAAGYVIGGMALTSLFQLRSGNRPDDHAIARAICQSVVVTRPLWLILLVTPWLIANGFYFLYLISIESPLLGAWGTLLPVGLLAIMLAYMHRWTWPASPQASHTAIGVVAVVLALVLPVVFVVKISPMPAGAEHWMLALLEAMPRLAHGVLMAVVLAGLLLGWRLGDAHGPLAGKLSQSTPGDARQALLRVALVGLFLQFLVGPVVLMTLHWEFMSLSMGAFLGLGLAASIAAMVMLSVDVNAMGHHVGRFLPPVVALLLLTVFSMAMSRHVYRDRALAPGAEESLRLATHNLEPVEPPRIRAMPGRELYITHCNICHATETMAPPISELYTLHKGDPNAIVQWAMRPDRRRARYGPMPPMRHVGIPRLKQIAEYILAIGEYQAAGEQDQTTQAPTPAP